MMKRRRRLYTYWRFALYLLREFRWPLLIFWGLVFGGGALISLFYHDKQVGYMESAYAVFMMVFVQNTLGFPHEWYLQALWFLLPIVGLGAVADSVVRLGYLVFARKEKLQEWHMMHVSSMRNHFVVVGAGKVGFRIITELLPLEEDVVAVERRMDTPLVEELLDLGVPIIQGECRLKKTLVNAGVEHARAVILATDDDLANIDSALTAREIRPDVRVVLRLFDDTLATKVATAFHMSAISPSATSAPAFIAAATSRSVFAAFSLDGGETLHVADVCVAEGSLLAGRTLGEIQQQHVVNVIMHKRDGQTLVNPEHALCVQSNDRMLIIAPIDRIARLERKG